MSLAAPLWLLFLLPWTFVALWLLRGYRPTALVPFLHLWPDEPPPPEQRPRRRLPSWPILLLLAAALLAILAAARPGLAIAGRVQPPLIIVDRGITQLAGDRYSSLVAQAAQILESACLPEALADVRFVPGPTLHIPVRDLSREMLARPAWPLATHADLPAAIEQARRDATGPAAPPILILSDQPLAPISGILQASSGHPVQNVGIESISAADQPAPQVMLRLRNDSPQQAAELTITSAGQAVSKTAKLPAPGESADLFVDLPALGETIEARLTAPDDLLADNVAYLVREGRAVRPAARTVLPAELTRMVDVHNRLHAGQAATTEVDISTTPLAPSASGVLLATTSGQPVDLRPATHASHPLLQNVTLPPDALLASNPPGEGWTIVASLNSTPILATREKPSRQVWVGFSSASWARQVDFVIFWTNTFNSLGGQQSRFISERAHALPAGWEPISPTTARAPAAPAPTAPAPAAPPAPAASTAPTAPAVPAAPAGPAGIWPGLYRRGTLITAINAPAPSDLNATALSSATAPAAAASWQDALRQQMSPHPARRELTPWLLLSAMLLALAAAMGHSMRSSHADLPAHEPDILD